MARHPFSPEVEFVRNCSEFAVNFYSAIAPKTKGNIVLSPFSIYACGGLLYMGADHHTSEEIAFGLNLPVDEREDVGPLYQKALDKLKKVTYLRICNKIYVSQKFDVKPEYRKLVTDYLRAEQENLDFEKPDEAIIAINHWIRTKTDNTIKSIVDDNSVNRDTIMFLINVIMFKGLWKNAFNAQATREKPFWISETENKLVRTMYYNGNVKCIPHCPKLNASVIELDYKDPGDISMMIILPFSRTGIHQLEQTLKKVNLLCMSTKMQEMEVIVELPKFVIECVTDLKNPFGKLGMISMFTDQADFSFINKNRAGLKVSKAIHKAYIEVDEAGAKASAVTAIGVQYLSANTVGPFHFRADHPFFFAIKSKLQLLFIGRFLG